MTESDFARKQKEDFINSMESSGELENCVANEDGKLKVNWRNVTSLPEDDEPMRHYRILTYLRYKEILTHPKSGSIFLQCDGADLSPRRINYFHFTNETDAEEFSEAKYGNSMFKKRIEIKKLRENEVRFY